MKIVWRLSELFTAAFACSRKLVNLYEFPTRWGGRGGGGGGVDEGRERCSAVHANRIYEPRTRSTNGTTRQ